MQWFLARPWLLVILAFVVLISAWVILFVLADRNLPEFIEVQTFSTQRGQDVVC